MFRRANIAANTHTHTSARAPSQSRTVTETKKSGEFWIASTKVKGFRKSLILRVFFVNHKKIG